jgi:hypothetical protein
LSPIWNRPVCGLAQRESDRRRDARFPRKADPTACQRPDQPRITSLV